MTDAPGRIDAGGLVARTVAALRYAWNGQRPTDWFGPGQALPDQAPIEVRGRAFDYPAFVNINYRPRNTERVGFDKLKALAATCEPLKLVMARQRDLVRSLEWTVKPRKRVGLTSAKPDDAAIGAIMDKLERPDGEHDWAQWIGAVLDQMFVIDAVSIYGRPTLGGDLHALELIDGATITPLIDAGGRRPAAPDAAYKQVLKGLSATHYTADELIYFPETYRVDHIYGWSRVEQIIETAEMTIERMKSQKGYFTEGNTGDGFFTAPPNWTPEQVSSFERSWNSVMHGEGGRRTADRRQVPWAPNGTEFKPTTVGLSDPLFDEWLIRLVCFTFGVAPTAFLKQQGLGHGSATTEQAAAEEGGSAPVMDYVRRLMNRIIADWFKRPDLEFVHSDDREFDPAVAAEIDDKRLRNGSRTIDEVRDRNGEPPLPGGVGAKPLIYTAGGAELLETVLDPPEPPPALAPALPGPTDPAHQDDDEALGKAASPAGEAKLARALRAYLNAKAIETARVITGELGLVKAASDDPFVRIDGAFEAVDWTWSDLPARVEPLIAGIAAKAGTSAVSELGLFDKATLAKVTERATAWAKDRAAEMVGRKWVAGELVDNPDAAWSIAGTTRTQLRTLVENAMERGDSNADLAKEIRGATAFSKDRADTIARTESAIADTQGAIQGWRESGLVAGKQWLTAPDCCDECQELDGLIVALDEDFPDGDAPLHPNCRCAVTPVLPEDMPDAPTAADVVAAD